MPDNWKTWFGLFFIALCGSMVRWPDLLKDKTGWTRVTMIVTQCGIAVATGALGYGGAQIALHWLPWAGAGLQVFLTSLLAFAGPLFIADALNKGTDAIRKRLGGGA